jgi:flagellin
MSSVINTNIASLNAQRNLNSSQSALQTSLQRLSSGLRINSAKDDAAGLAISQRMTSQINGSNQAARNANDGISLAQTAESDLSQIGDNLQRMRELAVQSANGTNTDSDRAALDKEVQQLSSEIDRLASSSSFNGVKLLDGSLSSQQFQVGANAGQTVQVSGVASARTSALGVFTGFNSQDVGTIAGTAGGTPGTLTIGLTGGSNVTVSNVGDNAKDIAAAINNSGVTGLTATASAAVATGGNTNPAATVTAGNVKFSVNGVNVTVAVGSDNTQNRSNTLAAINAVSSSTGVVATDTGSGLKLTAADGRNVDLGAIDDTADSTGAVAGNLGLDGIDNKVTSGSVSATYVRPDGSSISGITISGAGIATGNALSVGATGNSIAATDVLTADHATKALTSIDAALASVNNSRAALGAMQNRFTSVVSSLQSSSENLSAARSRIQDTDFAAESANMTRNQILQQAGTAMLAQANQLPNSVMSLLR